MLLLPQLLKSRKFYVSGVVVAFAATICSIPSSANLSHETDKAEAPKATASPNTARVSAPGPAEGEIRDVGNGIKVHVSIADQVRAMLLAAAADGVELRGGGYRSADEQIAVRKVNCGTSNYAIYEQPSSTCTPPTARPGNSMHEKGKAIDFTDGNGATIRVDSPGYVWLTNNSATYGLQNFLASHGTGPQTVGKTF